jgi:hypothetical protein
VQLEGEDYAQVPVTVDFQCGIEQFVNLMAGVANAPALLSTRRVRMTMANPSTKSVKVQLTVSGYLPVSRTPELQPKSGSTGAAL